MLCVILGHMEIADNLKHFIFSFHMPLFFLLSGYFLNPQNINRFAKSKARHLLIPYLFTGICLLLLTQIKNAVKSFFRMGRTWPAAKLFVEWIKAILLGSGSRTDFRWIHSEITVGAVWFLLALFFSQLIVCFLSKKKFAIGYVIGIAMTGLITARYFWLPFSVQPAAIGTVFVMTGYLVRGGGYSIQDILDNKRITCACMILWVIYLGMCFGCNVQLNMVSARLPWGMIDIVCSMAASVVIFWISYKIIPLFPKAEIFLSWFGRNSMIVLCFHLIEMTCVPIEGVVVRGMSFLGIYDRPVVMLLVYVLKIVWACSAIVIVGRIRILRFVFGNVT